MAKISWLGCHGWLFHKQIQQFTYLRGRWSSRDY